jgi:pheromone shutdown protein TraB
LLAPNLPPTSLPSQVFRTQYSNPLYARLAVEARDAWIANPLLNPAYHESGYVFAVSGKSQASIDDWQQACNNSRALGAEMTELKTKEEYLAKAPFMQGEMK